MADDRKDAMTKELRARFDAQQLFLERSIVAGDDGLSLAQAHAQFFETVIRDLFHAVAADPRSAPKVAVAAVGSLGRGALGPRSDVDLRFIVAKASSATRVESLVEAMLYPLWDAGLSVGHQIIDAEGVLELAHSDLTTSTALLDLRYIEGDRSLQDDLLERAWAGVFGEGELGRFIEKLRDEATERHERFGGSLFLLEPDVKNGRGGLRDLEAARWAMRARFRVGERPHLADGTMGDAWADMVRLGILLAREAHEIRRAENFLYRLRNRLHLRSKRRADRLTFDEQEALGAAMGFGEEPAEAAEKLMHQYYLEARVLSQAHGRFLDRATPPKKRGKPVEVDLGDGLRLFDGQVTIAGASELSATPVLALRMYLASTRRGAKVLNYARDLVIRAAADPAFCANLRASREAQEAFVELATTAAEGPMQGGSILGELHEVGLLVAMIPEFAPATGRMQHDVYHVYTVDVHSVAALDRLRAFARGELAKEFPLASRLAAEITRPETVFLATLLHDIGKGYPDENGSRRRHAEVGADLCSLVLPRLGLTAEQTESAADLIRQHLLMYHVATRRDLDDPKTIEDFSKQVRGREALRDLYLLTVADLSTTSPTAMTTWKARMLDELYWAADRFFEGGTGGGEEAAVRAISDEACSVAGAPREAVATFIRSMPVRYVLANPPASIAAHAQVSISRKGAACKVAIVPSRHEDIAELCVVAADRPGLLAAIAATLSASRLEVLAAQVYTRPCVDGTEALDLFWVRARSDEQEEHLQARLSRDLERVCTGAVEPGALLAERLGGHSLWRERPTPAVATEVQIDDRASPTHTVVEVFAKDRPGLLFRVADTLHSLGLSIALSKINTEGTKAADVFYVTETTGEKVAGAIRHREIRERLLLALTG